jgi:hypothetical protein
LASVFLLSNMTWNDGGRLAEAVNRLDLTETQTQGIPELMEDIA